MERNGKINHALAFWKQQESANSNKQSPEKASIPGTPIRKSRNPIIDSEKLGTTSRSPTNLSNKTEQPSGQSTADQVQSTPTLEEINSRLLGSVSNLVKALNQKARDLDERDRKIAALEKQTNELRGALSSVDKKAWNFFTPIEQRAYYRGTLSDKDAKSLPNFIGQTAVYHVVNEGERHLKVAIRISENEVKRISTDAAEVNDVLKQLGADYVVSDHAGAISPMQKEEPPLRERPYFHGYLSAPDASDRLRSAPDGTYLLRARVDQPHSEELCISRVSPDNKILHTTLDSRKFVGKDFLKNLQDLERRLGLTGVVRPNGEVVDVLSMDFEPYSTVV